MFNIFKSKDYVMPEIPKTEVVTKEQERTFYSLGPTTEGRVMLRVHYGNVSFNRLGIDNMIKALEASKIWLEESGNDPQDGCQEEEKPV
jgi:hypothetical protein